MAAKPLVVIHHKADDESIRSTLRRQLAAHQEVVEVWDHDCIKPGDDHARDTQRATDEAKVVVLVLSAAFLAAPDLGTGRSIEEHVACWKEQGTNVYALLAKPCAWEHAGWLTDISRWPPHQQPIVSRSEAEQEDDLKELALDIRGHITGQPSSRRQKAEAEFRTHIADTYRKLNIQMRSSEPISLPLDQAFVDLKYVPDIPPEADTFPVDERRLLAEMGSTDPARNEELRLQLEQRRADRHRTISRIQPDRWDAQSALARIADITKGPLVLLGDPGTGKTTLLHIVAYRAAAAGKLDGDLAETSQGQQHLLPIFVPLSAYDAYLERHKTEARISLLDYLSVYWKDRADQPHLDEVFQSALNEGRAVVLLDGLDEVLTVHRRLHVKEQVEDLIRTQSPKGNRVVITSRSIGYREAPLSSDRCEQGMLLHFGSKDIETFLKSWCIAVRVWSERQDNEAVRGEGVKLALEIGEELKANSPVYDLATTPLMLSMLTVLRIQEGRFPNRAIEVYKRFLDLLLEHQPVKRSPGARDTPPERIEILDKRSHLRRLALWLMENRPSGTASRDDLLWVLGEQYIADEADDPQAPSEREKTEAKKKADLLFNELRHLSGIVLERGRDAFGFSHLTFQEFFAAEALTDLPSGECWKRVSPQLHEARWRKTITLCAGWLGVLKGSADKVDEFVRRIRGAESKHEAILHRDLFLVMECVAQDVRVSNRVKKEMFGELWKYKDDRIAAIRSQAKHGIASLANLGYEPAIEFFVNDLQGEITETAQSSMDSLFEGNLNLAETCCKPILNALLDRCDRLLVRISGGKMDFQLASILDRELDIIVLGLYKKPLKYQPDIRRRVFQACRASRTGFPIVLLGMHEEELQADEELRSFLLHEVAEGNQKHNALRFLAPLASEDETVKDIFVKCRDQDDEDSWRAIVYGTKYLAPRDSTWLKYLRQCVADTDVNVRTAAIRALAELALQIPALRRDVAVYLGNAKSSLVGSALESGGRLVLVDQEIQARVCGLLSHPLASVRQRAAHALAPLISKNTEVFQGVQGLLADDRLEVRQAAIGVLAPMASKDEDLKRRLSCQMDCMNGCSLEARIETCAPRYRDDFNIQERLLGFLEHPEPSIRVSTLRSISSAYAAGDSSWLEQVVRVAKTEGDFNVRAAAIQVLGGYAGDDPRAMDTLLEILGGDDLRPALASAQALTRFVDEPRVRNALKGRWRREKTPQAFPLIQALGRWVNEDKDLRDAFRQRANKLVDMAASGRRYSQNQWIEAFGGMAPAAGYDSEIRDILLALRGRPGVGWWAFKALMKHPSDPQIRELIDQALQSENVAIQTQAMTALAGHPGVDVETHPQYIRCLNHSLDHEHQPVLLEYSLSKPTLHPAVEQWVSDQLRALPTFHQPTGSFFRAPWRMIWLPDHLGPHLAAHPDWQQALRAYLGLLEDNPPLVNQIPGVVAAIVCLLASRMASDPELRNVLLPWLGFCAEATGNGLPVRRALAQAFAPLLPNDPALTQHIRAMLNSPAWQDRQGAAWTLWASPIEKSPDDLRILQSLLDDERGEESWFERLELAAVFINHPDPGLSAKATGIVWQALELPQHPWSFPLHQQIRQRASQVLSQLEPLFYDECHFKKLNTLVDNESDLGIVNALFQTLLRMAAAPEPTTADDNDSEENLPQP